MELTKMERADDSHTIFARVLDDTDERGLWIELNTNGHEKDPAVELQALMIPWHAVLAVVIGNDFASVVEESHKVGAALTNLGSGNGSKNPVSRNLGSGNLGRTNGNSRLR